MNAALRDLAQHASVLALLALLFLACEDPERAALEAKVSALEAERAALVAQKTALEAELAAVKAAAPTPSADRPEWIEKGSYTDEAGARYGVGKVSGVRNAALARTTADNRARAEIAKMVGTATEVTQGDGSTKIRTVSATLEGVEIVDHWVDPSDGTVYALARKAN